MDIYNKIQFLVNYLNEHTKYYDSGNPQITDTEWDNKYFELKELEEKTGLILSNSPTQTIIYENVNELKKSEHNHKMLSLDKTKSTDSIVSFVGSQLCLAMCKMDGLTCSLTYKNGKLISAETRGNGLVGEDILHNIKVLPSVPSQIPFLDEITIDGEIICTYDDFKDFSSQYKNPRNFAAGSIRLLNAKECASRKLTFVAWDVITSLYNDEGIEERVDQKLNWISSFGFTIVPYTAFNGSMINNIICENIINDIKTVSEQNGYPIDGVVFKFADCAYGRSLGETTHHFKNAIAYKFADDVYITYLLDINWTMGRTGALTPVAIFEPIDIDGSTVEKASLHNISVMKELLGEPYEGQKVEVFKANMIIPQIHSAVKMSEDFLHYPEVPFINIPKVCPVCGGQVEQITEIDSTILMCVNPACDGKLINRLDHFCGKKGLDMKGISKATIEKLIDWGWVSCPTDIFELVQYKNEWIQKPGFGIKSVEKVFNAVAVSANCELHQFIAALGIPLIGTTASKELAKHFGSWNNFIEAVENRYAFYELPNFGVEMHRNLINFNYAEAKLLAEHYITFKTADRSDTPAAATLEGKVFVITGKLSHFKNRDAIKDKIEALGGKVSGSVSKNTHYLINNDVNSTSSKNQTAKSLNIPILSEADFIQTFGIVD